MHCHICYQHLTAPGAFALAKQNVASDTVLKVSLHWQGVYSSRQHNTVRLLLRRIDTCAANIALFAVQSLFAASA